MEFPRSSIAEAIAKKINTYLHDDPETTFLVEFSWNYDIKHRDNLISTMTDIVMETGQVGFGVKNKYTVQGVSLVNHSKNGLTWIVVGGDKALTQKVEGSNVISNAINQSVS